MESITSNLKPLPYIDLCFAEHFKQEEAVPFLCFLLGSLRQGHLCVRIEEQIQPHPREIWNESPLSDEELEQLIRAGIEHLPPNIIRVEKNHYYLKNYYEYETRLWEELQRLLHLTPGKKVDPQALDLYLSKQNLTDEQAFAIKSGGAQCLTLISGGPGTGKTYTAGHLITALQTIIPDLEIAIAAPTGKAAARLQKSLKGVKAKTLHSLLEVHKEKQVKLKADIVLVDECSMIDIKLMVRLLSSLKEGARLIMLGDPFQLPPVEAGNIFADFVTLLPQSQLTQCLRAENRQLIDLAKCVHVGDCQAALHFMETAATPTQLLEEVLQQWQEFPQDEKEILRLFDRFRILSPLRKGPWGVEEVNRWFYNKRPKLAPIPILLTHHAKEFELYNGDTGVLVGDVAYFEGVEEVKKISVHLLPQYELAYCLSVHKSQGSEYEQVFILLPEGSEHFGRQALYTAITRAKRRVVIWGDVKKMIEKQQRRISGILQR